MLGKNRLPVEGVVLLSATIPELPAIPVASPYFLQALGGGKLLSLAVSPFTFSLSLSDCFGSAGLGGSPAGVRPRVCLPLPTEVNVSRPARRAREGGKHNGAGRRVGEGCVEVGVVREEESPMLKCCRLVPARANRTRGCNVEPLYRVALETKHAVLQRLCRSSVQMAYVDDEYVRCIVWMVYCLVDRWPP